MRPDEIIVGFLGIISIIFVYWFFLMKKEDETLLVKDQIIILVKGGYNPSVIQIHKNRITKIIFQREDSSPCLEEVIIPKFRIKKYLPLHQKVTASVNPKEEGEYEFSCGMNMFHGKIVVK